MVKRIIITGLICLFVGAVCYFVGWRAGRLYNHDVNIKLINKSDFNILEARVIHEKGINLAVNINKGQTKEVNFPVNGETSYTVQIQFENGNKIESTERYAESRYCIEETVTDKEIKSEILLPKY